MIKRQVYVKLCSVSAGAQPNNHGFYESPVELPCVLEVYLFAINQTYLNILNGRHNSTFVILSFMKEFFTSQDFSLLS